MTDPSDTDRLIDATRAEAHKTRVLLAWIFIGMPLAGLLIWGFVVGISSIHASPDTTSDSIPGLSLSSTCQQLETASADELSTFDEENNGEYAAVADEADANCTAHPDWTISQAIAPPVNP